MLYQVYSFFKLHLSDFNTFIQIPNNSKAMSSNVFYLLSLPSSAAPSGGDPEDQLESWYSSSLNLPSSDVHHFDIPSFKIGTLDSLVQQSEELAKLDGQFGGIESVRQDDPGHPPGSDACRHRADPLAGDGPHA